MTVTHPNNALFQTGSALPLIPACEHFAGNEKFIRKAVNLQLSMEVQFDVTCDCEDGAPTGEEYEHAVMVGKLIAELGGSKNRLGIRIHDPMHQACHDDVDILMTEAGQNISYLTIPKPLGYDDAARTVEYIQKIATKNGVPTPPIHILIETQSALSEVFQIASIDGLEGLTFGLLDFVSDHRGAVPASAMRSPNQFAHQLTSRAKVEVAAAALRYGLIATHNPCLEIQDRSVAFNDAKTARDNYGYMRMYSIHPSQIESIVSGMQPSEDEIETAGDILLAAQSANWGPISHNNEMHDRASYRYFWNLLQRANINGASISPAAKNAFFQ
ncbi:aldolase/citrate lyase family protein [Burkholderiales bacterium]|nr:aldolase/citrate lyase family protein [Burkholderiales bacterium]